MFAALYAPALPVAALIDVARAFTPRFEQRGSVVLLDASGLSRLFGTAQELGEHLRDALAKQCVGDTVPRVAIASTHTAATLLVLGTPGLTVVMPGKEAIALAPLSVSVLDQFEHLFAPAPAAPVAPKAPKAPSSAPEAPKAPQALNSGGWHHPRSTHHASRGRRRAPDNRQLEILQKWGIRTLGALAALPDPDIHERLGHRGAEWQALARGVDARPIVPWVDDIPFEGALELEWPIEGFEPLSFVLARLLEPLAERLERADRGAAVIYTSLRLTSRTIFTRALPLPAPMRDPKTLRTLVLLDLESHPPDAPIDVVRVCIEPTPAKVLQWTLLERAQPAPEQVSTLIARLTALMGEGHVGSPRVVDTWKPGAFEITAFGVQECTGAQVQGAQVQVQSAQVQGAALRRFRFAIPARVTVAEGRPVRVQVDRQGFTSGAIVQSAGPWRTSGNWWSASAREQSGDRAVAASGREGGPDRSSDAWDRDEWDVSMMDGTVYRLAVERGVGQWFLEGVID